MGGMQGRMQGARRAAGRWEGRKGRPLPQQRGLPRGFPSPRSRMLWGIRPTTGAQRCSARNQRPMHGEERATAGDGGQGGRGGWVRGELDKTKPAGRQQVNPAVLPPPTKKPLRAQQSHLQYILYILL